jgi:hypothetical protein
MSHAVPSEEITTTEITNRLLAAIRDVDGLRPAAPARQQPTRWLAFDAGAMAIDVSAELVEIRVVATALPLPPLLKKAEAECRAALAGSKWADAGLRMIVVDLDATAF